MVPDFPFQPLHDRVVVKRLPHPMDTRVEAIGMVLPETAKVKSYWGVVLAVGPGGKHYLTGELIPISLRAGDKVLYLKYSGTDFNLDGDSEEYICIKESDVIGVLRA